MNRCQNYIISGIYRMNPSLTIIYNNTSTVERGEIQQYLFGNQSESNYIFKILTKLVFRYVRNNGERFSGQVITISTNEKDYKVFDYSSSTLLTVFDSPTSLKDVYTKRMKWGEHFPVIESELIGDDNALQEVIFYNVPFNHLEMFSTVVNDYITYFEKACFDISYITEDDLKLFNRFRVDFDISCCFEREQLVEKKIKRCITHGDLWCSNILSDNILHYYIDFENVGLRVFYYDIIMYMFSEELILCNSQLLSKYFDGSYDCIMEQLFNAAGEVYYKESKDLYFLTFLYTLYSDRWKGTQSSDTTIKVKKIIAKYLG